MTRGFHFVCLLLALGLLLGLSGCPPKPAAKVVTVFTAGATAKAQVDVGDIQSLTVTLTGIVLDKRATEGEGEGEGELEGETPSDSAVLLDQPMDVDLLQLQDVGAVLSNVTLPAGTYEKVRLSISNPRLVLKSDPATEITDIHLTANSRLFINSSFEIPQGQVTLLQIDFGGLHLVATGQGKYVLTPQVTADITVVVVESTATGTISAVDPANSTLTLTLASGAVQVKYAAAQIFRAADTTTPTGTAADLSVGTEIEATGTLYTDGSIGAATLRILPAP